MTNFSATKVKVFRLEDALKEERETVESLKTYVVEIQASARERFQKQEITHVSKLATVKQQLQMAREEQSGAQQREVQTHIALYKERDVSEAERERANAFAAAYVKEKAETSHLREVGRSLLTDFYKMQEERDMYKVRLRRLFGIAF